MDRLDKVAARLRSRASVAGSQIPRTTLSERMEELKVPAVSVAVLEPDGSVSERAWGADPRSMFQAASISKAVNAVGAVNVISDLDVEVNELLKRWQLPDGAGVTPRRILGHCAGLGVHGFPGYVRGGPIPSVLQILDGTEPTNTEAVRVIVAPGERQQYSGGGTTVLQTVMEDVTGESYTELMWRVVLEPLAMSDSTYEQPLPTRLHDRAVAGQDASGEPIEGSWRVHPEQAAAGLWTTPSDLVAVAREMISPGRVLDEAMRDSMLVPNGGAAYGLGWGLDGDWFGHGGANAGFRCQLTGSVAQRRAAAVMANADSGGAICAELIAAIAQEFSWDGYLRERTAFDVDQATMHRVAGVYAGPAGFTLTVRIADGRLVSSGAGLPELQLHAASPGVFFRTDFDPHIRWTDDALHIDAAGTTYRLEKQS